MMKKFKRKEGKSRQRNENKENIYLKIGEKEVAKGKKEKREIDGRSHGSGKMP